MIFSSRLVKKERIASQVYHLVFEVPPEFRFTPGQFALMDIILEDGSKLKRAYSIASGPSLLPKIEFCIKIVEGGAASPQFEKMEIGTEVKSVGPLGNFIRKDPARTAVFIATGTGIAPFRSMLLDKSAASEMYLLFGARYETDLLYEEEMQQLAVRDSRFHYTSILSRPKDTYEGNKGYVQDLLDTELPAGLDADYYLCGISNMVESVKMALEQRGIPATKIFCEIY
ncbi:FAD-dependent oxidoreductase [Candidatus Woesearchaeota archaeon]|nr:FAD-dependent oxidoreductase [Candidatus Woesearchaeota archaeon]